VGKIAKNGWREQFSVSMPNTWQEYLETTPVATNFNFSYTGPFFIRCNHGCSHSCDVHATYSVCTAAASYESEEGQAFRPGRVVHRSVGQLQQAGFVLVWAGLGEDALDTAYGSLVEIGIAHALGKPILLVHHPNAKIRDFWFAIEAATAVVCAENPIDALEMLWADRSSR
jgi:hypothetical protein